MPDKDYITREEFNLFLEKYNDLLSMLQRCNLKTEPDFSGLNHFTEQDKDFMLDQEEFPEEDKKIDL